MKPKLLSCRMWRHVMSLPITWRYEHGACIQGHGASTCEQSERIDRSKVTELARANKAGGSIDRSIDLWLHSPLLDIARFFSFLILYTVGKTPWTGDEPVARPLPTYRTTQTQNKSTGTSMHWVGSEPTIPAFERAKTVHALYRAATVIGDSRFRNSVSVVKWKLISADNLFSSWLLIDSNLNTLRHDCRQMAGNFILLLVAKILFRNWVHIPCTFSINVAGSWFPPKSCYTSAGRQKTAFWINVLFVCLRVSQIDISYIRWRRQWTAILRWDMMKYSGIILRIEDWTQQRPLRHSETTVSTWPSPCEIYFRKLHILFRYSDWLRAGRPRVRSLSQGRVKNFLFFTSSRPSLGPTSLQSNGYRGLFPRG
jgi:hypothetical protein